MVQHMKHLYKLVYLLESSSVVDQIIVDTCTCKYVVECRINIKIF